MKYTLAVAISFSFIISIPALPQNSNADAGRQIELIRSAYDSYHHKKYDKLHGYAVQLYMLCKDDTAALNESLDDPKSGLFDILYVDYMQHANYGPAAKDLIREYKPGKSTANHNKLMWKIWDDYIGNMYVTDSKTVNPQTTNVNTVDVLAFYLSDFTDEWASMRRDNSPYLASLKAQVIAYVLAHNNRIVELMPLVPYLKYLLEGDYLAARFFAKTITNNYLQQTGDYSMTAYDKDCSKLLLSTICNHLNKNLKTDLSINNCVVDSEFYYTADAVKYNPQEPFLKKLNEQADALNVAKQLEAEDLKAYKENYQKLLNTSAALEDYYAKNKDDKGIIKWEATKGFVKILDERLGLIGKIATDYLRFSSEIKINLDTLLDETEKAAKLQKNYSIKLDSATHKNFADATLMKETELKDFAKSHSDSKGNMDASAYDQYADKIDELKTVLLAYKAVCDYEGSKKYLQDLVNECDSKIKDFRNAKKEIDDLPSKIAEAENDWDRLTEKLAQDMKDFDFFQSSNPQLLCSYGPGYKTDCAKCREYMQKYYSLKAEQTHQDYRSSIAQENAKLDVYVKNIQRVIDAYCSKN